eukprot:TRINITY_DN144_c0_g1_i1.p1 TRINITY_DN144_c0_g1~~TRINITY_DN144_c0_g1_i1.p1  ORF type:complete len:487 (-),score=133.73 TRINITY_DN144_c0_g1_i1:70-1530(-)
MSLDSAIANLVSRLETVTSRLESVEKQLATGGGNAGAAKGSSSAASGGDDGSSSASVQAYEALINQYITPYVNISGQLGAPEVAEQAALVQQAVNAQRDMLRIAASSKKPSQDVLQKLLGPTNEAMQKIVALRDAKRSSKFFNHLSTVSEGIPALGWVLVSPTPVPHVNDMRSGAEFYSNRILKDFKGKEQVHVDWVNAFIGFLKDLAPFVKQFHTTGLEWNPRGGDASSAATSAPAASSGSGAPPPPGPPPPAFTPEPEKGGKAADPSALFKALNQGTDISKGLKKVTADQKTKNRPENERSSVVPAAAPKATTTTSKTTGKTETVKPPKFQLEGSKWVVENQIDNRNIVISDIEPKQTLYMYKCKNTTVQVKGKINAITMDSCLKSAVVFESLVSSCDIVNCQSVEVQITGKVPSISVDKTDGIQLYIGKDALDTEIFTSKSSEMNVLIPGATEQDDLVEISVPEQFKTNIKNGKLITESNTHV